MLDAIHYLDIVRIVVFVLIISIASIYSIPILSVKRLRTPINILTVNVCINCIICAIYWTIYYILHIILPNDLNRWNCVFFQYIQTIVNCQEIYALSNVTINRFCIIIFNNKLLFKTQRWIFICIGLQWLLGLILPLPILYINGQTCDQLDEPIWLRIYVLMIVLIIPIIVFLIVNSIILYHAHTARRRIAPMNNMLPDNNRDIRLIKRMIILILLFTMGWGPVYILLTIQNSSSSIWFEIFKFLAELSLLGEMINLFLYNREIRLYVKEKFFYYMNFI